MSDDRHKDGEPSPLAAAGAGYMLLASVLVGFGLGWGLDVWLATRPWGMVICTLVFILAGLYQVVKEHWPRS